jgi:hypothetical protein
MNEVCTRINKTLRRSFKLKKIDLSFNYLRSRLFSLMRGLFQPLEYLNLQDCRLDSTDIAYLNTTSMLQTLGSCKELNLGMNDFSQSYSNVFNIIANCTQLNCLSISYCQIPIEYICQHLVGRVFLNTPQQKKSSSSFNAMEEDDDKDNFTKLKVIYLQPFTPPKMHEIIDIIHSFSLITSLEKMCFLPSLYAFPGANDIEREINAIKVIQICSSIFQAKGRSDIEFINL